MKGNTFGLSSLRNKSPILQSVHTLPCAQSKVKPSPSLIVHLISISRLLKIKSLFRLPVNKGFISYFLRELIEATMAAVELCAATSPEKPPSRGISPRISFSHDLSKYDVVPIEPHPPLNPSSLFASANFNFYSHNNNTTSFPSHADELFSNGVLLPLQPKKQPLPLPPPSLDSKTGEPQSQSQSRSASTSSFWKFKRSRSFNCGSIYRGTLCPLLLSRSKSTGSNSSSKRSLVLPKDDRSLGGVKQRSLSSPSYPGYQKPPLKKSYGSNTVSPVLNVSSGNLFGLGSIFSSFGKPGADKIHKKKLVI